VKIFILILVIHSIIFSNIYLLTFNFQEKESKSLFLINSSTFSLSNQFILKDIWNKTIGGDQIDVARSITRSKLGGYAITGWTNSSGKGNYDIYVLRISDNGTIIWNQTFGSTGEDQGYQIIESGPSNFAISSTFINETALFPNSDFLVIKMLDNGTLMWNRTYSGPEQTSTSMVGDLGRSIVECSNGDLALAGVTVTNTGHSDVWLFRVSPLGIKKWERTYHNLDIDRCYTPHSLIECSNGDFAIACYTYNSTKSNDVWLIRTDQFGNPKWNKTFGSDGYERPEALIECQNGDFAIIGNTKGFGAGGQDAWLIRTDPFGNQLWNKTYGGIEEDKASQIVEMLDGGFTIVGTTHSFDIGQGDGWIIRTDSFGNVIWNLTIGTINGDGLNSLVSLGNGSYVLAGITHEFGEVLSDIWIIKIQVSEAESDSYANNLIKGYELLILIITPILLISIIYYRMTKKNKIIQ